MDKEIGAIDLGDGRLLTGIEHAVVVVVEKYRHTFETGVERIKQTIVLEIVVNRSGNGSLYLELELHSQELVVPWKGVVLDQFLDPGDLLSRRRLCGKDAACRSHRKAIGLEHVNVWRDNAVLVGGVVARRALINIGDATACRRIDNRPSARRGRILKCGAADRCNEIERAVADPGCGC